MRLFMVILAYGNDERHYFQRADTPEDALSLSMDEWRDEFPGVRPALVYVSPHGA